MTRPNSTPVLLDIAAERAWQHEKWGEQNHPNGTGPDASPMLCSPFTNAQLAGIAKRQSNQRAASGTVTYADILVEEVCEALAESDPAKLRAELVQVAAVAAQWVEAIDRAKTRGAAA